MTRAYNKTCKETYISPTTENSFPLLLNTSLLVIFLFKGILCIYHPLYFKKNQAEVKALLDFSSETNAITPAYVTRLGFKI